MVGNKLHVFYTKKIKILQTINFKGFLGNVTIELITPNYSPSNSVKENIL